LLERLASEVSGQEVHIRDYASLSSRDYIEILEALYNIGPEGEFWATRALDGGAVYLVFIPKQGDPSCTAVDREKLKQQQTCSALIAFLKGRLKVPDGMPVRVWWSPHSEPSKPGPKGLLDDESFEDMVWVARSWAIEEQ